jgi:hypothetical protein
VAPPGIKFLELCLLYCLSCDLALISTFIDDFLAIPEIDDFFTKDSFEPLSDCFSPTLFLASADLAWTFPSLF